MSGVCSASFRTTVQPTARAESGVALELDELFSLNPKQNGGRPSTDTKLMYLLCEDKKNSGGIFWPLYEKLKSRMTHLCKKKKAKKYFWASNCVSVGIEICQWEKGGALAGER